MNPAFRIAMALGGLTCVGGAVLLSTLLAAVGVNDVGPVFLMGSVGTVLILMATLAGL